MEFDLQLNWKDEKKSLSLTLTDEVMGEAGQHGAAVILESNEDKWLLKVFNTIIDHEMKEIPFLDVDLSEDPDKMKSRLQFWRAINEYSASLLAYELELPVPVCYLVCSQKVSDFTLEEDTILPLGKDVLVLDEELGAPDTAEEFYFLSGREQYTIKTSEKFEKLLRDRSLDGDETTVIGVLTRLVPNSKTLQGYFDSEEFETVVEKVSKLDDAFKLIPFDVFLNDPDRNQGNYLVEFGKGGELLGIHGIDYEMWSFSDDIWMDSDEITKGRSYLTAIIHRATSFFDERVLETFYRISTMSDIDIEYLTLSPSIILKLIEYHIKNDGLDADERYKIQLIEENNRDFLFENIPKIDKLGIRLIRQIGLPKKNKELETKILDIDEDEFYLPLLTNVDEDVLEDLDDVLDDDEVDED